MNIQEEIKQIVGEIPNHIFEYLELSDDIKKEWKNGSGASDFGGHRAFVETFSKRVANLIAIKETESRLDEENKQLHSVASLIVNSKPHCKNGLRLAIELIHSRIEELEQQLLKLREGK